MVKLGSAAFLAVLVMSACTNDYDEFDFPTGQGGSSGGASGGSGSGAEAGAAGAAGAGGCASGETDCGGTCKNLATDPDNCGACGTTCGNGFSCVSSLCGCTAPEQCGDTSLAPSCSADGRCRCGAAECRPGERCVKQGSGSRCACNGLATCGADTICCPAGCMSGTSC